jgi:hypothetical protein
MRLFSSITVLLVSLMASCYGQPAIALSSITVKMAHGNWTLNTDDCPVPWIYGKSETLCFLRSAAGIPHVTVTRFFGPCADPKAAYKITRTELRRCKSIEDSLRKVAGVSYAAIKYVDDGKIKIVGECVFIPAKEETIMLGAVGTNFPQLDTFFDEVVSIAAAQSSTNAPSSPAALLQKKWPKMPHA